MKTITTIVYIGKSREEVAYTFKVEAFERIEDDRLILNNDDRRILIVPDMVTKTIAEINEI